MMNMKIQCNVISAAYAHGVKKLLFLGSTCIYPKNAPQSMLVKIKKALITGVTGQDGSYPSEFLLAKGYVVHGIIRRSSIDFRERIAYLEGQPNFHLHYANMSPLSN